MRIIAGSRKGHKLLSPATLEVRPTLDRVKESLFDLLGPEIEGLRVADLFAGTGNLCLEALSRGATRAVLVEKNPVHLAYLRRNIRKLRFGEQAEARRGDGLSLNTLAARLPGPFDLIFLDPPYAISDRLDFVDYLSRLGASRLLAPGGMLAIECQAVRIPFPAVPGLESCKERAYGRVGIVLLRKPPEEGSQDPDKMIAPEEPGKLQC